jgi:hypothetical protein
MAAFEEGDIERLILRLLLQKGAVLNKADFPRILLLR